MDALPGFEHGRGPDDPTFESSEICARIPRADGVRAVQSTIDLSRTEPELKLEWAFKGNLARTLFLFIGLGFSPGPSELVAQQAATEGLVRVFLDCQTFGCRGDAFDHFRREIAFVAWVRDRQVADVQILVTSDQTGAGGQLYTLAFLGLDRFSGRADTLTATTLSQATDDERRSSLTQVLALGLVPYAARSRVAERIEIGMAATTDAASDSEVDPENDPWDFWVFGVEGNAFLNGQSQTSFSSLFWSTRATRTTDSWKIRLRIDGQYNESNFETDDLTLKTISRGYEASGTVVRSLGSHWSAGLRAGLEHSTRSNQDVSLRLAPVIEYNFYPYSESTRRQMVVQYSAGVSSFDWIEETIFGNTSETRPDHSLVLGIEQRQPWGSVDVTLTGNQFLDDLETYSVSIGGRVQVRLFKGLSVRVGGSFTQVRDQIFLPLEDATEEEVLLQLTDLETDFSYFTSFGFEYTFGSIFNTVVNPRLNRGGRGRFN